MPRRINNSNNITDNNPQIDNQNDNSTDSDIKMNYDSQDDKNMPVNKQLNKEKQFLYGRLLKIKKGV